MLLAPDLAGIRPQGHFSFLLASKMPLAGSKLLVCGISLLDGLVTSVHHKTWAQLELTDECF